MVSKVIFVFLIVICAIQFALSTTLICRDGRYQCENKGACIPTEYVCDGRNDCSDGSDETNCINGRACKTKNCSHICYQNTYNGQAATCTCPGGYILASDGRTCQDINECESTPSLCSQNCTNTPGSFVCSCFEGFTQNEDGSCKNLIDGEVERPKLVCTGGKHPCDNGESCISEDFVCDGSTDCGDGSDETNCQGGRYCKLKQCDQLCTEFIGSRYTNRYSTSEKVAATKCSCRNGFELNENEKTCDDIDECAIGTHNCTQICTNTIGSFVCTCAEGFYYDVHALSCKASGKYPLFYISIGHKMLVHNIKRRRTYTYPINVTGTVEKIIYDRFEKRILSLESLPNGGYVVTSDQTGNKRQKINFEYEFVNPVDFAYDWINSKVYVTDPGNGLIVACDLEDGTCSSVVDKKLSRPTKIVLNPVASSEVKDRFSGSNRALKIICVVCRLGGSIPFTKGYQAAWRKMYWIDIGNNAGIYESGMDGSNVTVLVSSGLNEPSSLAFDPSTGTLLWADKKGLCSTIEGLKVHGMRRWTLYNDEPKPSNSPHFTNKPKLDASIINVGIFEDIVYLATDNSRIYSFPKMNKTINPKLELAVSFHNILSFTIHHPLLSPFEKYTNACNEANCTEMCLLSSLKGSSCTSLVKTESNQAEAVKSLNEGVESEIALITEEVPKNQDEISEKPEPLTSL